jgi:hypothetical protein
MNVGQRNRGIKGKYWALFSLYIRRRDFERFGTCISCGKTVSHYTEFDAGHFISAGNGGFLFFLMSEMSTASAGTITRSMAIIFYFIDAGWTPVMEPEQLTRLNRDIAMSTSKAKPRKSGTKSNTKRKSKSSKKS